MMLQPHRRMYLAAFLLDFAVAIGLTAMPFFIFQRLQGGPAMSGAVGAFQMALYALGCLLSASVVARAANGLYYALAGVALFAAPFTLLPWLTTPLLCAAAACLPFIGLALAWPALQSWLGAEPDPQTRARRLTGFNTATAFGFTLSPLLTGPLYDLDFRLPFGVLFLMCLLVAGLIRSLPPEHNRNAETGTEETPGERNLTVGNHPGLLYASWGATFTANGLCAAVRSVYPSRVEALVGDGNLTLLGALRPAWMESIGPATAFSWLAFILSLATVVCFAILGRTTFWQGRFSFMVAGQGVAAAALIGLAHTQSLAVMLACFVLVGANFGLCFYVSLFYSLADARQKHRRASINEGLLGAGGFAGGIGVGYAAGAVGLTVAFQWAPLFAIMVIAVQLMLLRIHRPSPTGQLIQPRPSREA